MSSELDRGEISSWLSSKTAVVEDGLKSGGARTLADLRAGPRPNARSVRARGHRGRGTGGVRPDGTGVDGRGRCRWRGRRGTSTRAQRRAVSRPVPGRHACGGAREGPAHARGSDRPAGVLHRMRSSGRKRCRPPRRRDPMLGGTRSLPCVTARAAAVRRYRTLPQSCTMTGCDPPRRSRTGVCRSSRERRETPALRPLPFLETGLADCRKPLR